MDYYGLGVACGFLLVFGVVLVARLAAKKLFLKDGTLKYDERQKLVQGEAYKYGFMGLLFSEIMLIALQSLFPKETWLQTKGMNIVVLLIGALIFASFCIWKDAYVGFNQNPYVVAMLLLVIGGVNVVAFVGELLSGEAEKADYGNVTASIACGGALVAVAAQILIKNFLDKKED